MIAREGSLISVMSDSECAGFEELSITLDVTYTSVAGAIDLDTLGGQRHRLICCELSDRFAPVRASDRRRVG